MKRDDDKTRVRLLAYGGLRIGEAWLCAGATSTPSGTPSPSGRARAKCTAGSLLVRPRLTPSARSLCQRRSALLIDAGASVKDVQQHLGSLIGDHHHDDLRQHPPGPLCGPGVKAGRADRRVLMTATGLRDLGRVCAGEGDHRGGSARCVGHGKPSSVCSRPGPGHRPQRHQVDLRVDRRGGQVAVP